MRRRLCRCLSCVLTYISSVLQYYIDELAKTLMEGADNPATPAHARMCQLINANVKAFEIHVLERKSCTLFICLERG